MTEEYGIIFDMDGVISDTQKFHSKAEAEILNKYGINISEQEITRKFSGVKTAEFFNELFIKNGFRDGCININNLLNEKWNRLISLAKGNISPIQGVIKLINILYRLKIFKTAIASASPEKFINLVISELSIANMFNAITSGDEVKKGKPAPDIFLLTAEKLSINPKKCLVIEDGISGMIAAKRAGMKCVGLISDNSQNYPAEVLIKSFSELTIPNIIPMLY